MKYKILFLITILFTTGCASMKESLITGASIGLVTGATLGNAQGRGDARDKSTRNGAVIGALLGAGLGYLGHKNKLKELDKSGLNTKSKQDDTPLLTRPKIKRVWIEDKVEGRRFIKGHWEYVIEEQSAWNQ